MSPHCTGKGVPGRDLPSAGFGSLGERLWQVAGHHRPRPPGPTASAFHNALPTTRSQGYDGIVGLGLRKPARQEGRAGQHPLSDPPPSEGRDILFQVLVFLAALVALVLINVVLFKLTGHILVPG